jgi:uncharacterized protein YejL (UPF0352 family)
MEVETRDWHALCEAASQEYDSEQLLALVSELVNVLDQKSARRPDLAQA